MFDATRRRSFGRSSPRQLQNRATRKRRHPKGRSRAEQGAALDGAEHGARLARNGRRVVQHRFETRKPLKIRPRRCERKRRHPKGGRTMRIPLPRLARFRTFANLVCCRRRWTTTLAWIIRYGSLTPLSMNWTFQACPGRREGDGPPRLFASRSLKLYIYGYLNRVRSSRRLEMEIVGY